MTEDTRACELAEKLAAEYQGEQGFDDRLYALEAIAEKYLLAALARVPAEGAPQAHPIGVMNADGVEWYTNVGPGTYLFAGGAEPAGKLTKEASARILNDMAADECEIERLTKALQRIAELPLGHHDQKKIAKEALATASLAEALNSRPAGASLEELKGAQLTEEDMDDLFDLPGFERVNFTYDRKYFNIKQKRLFDCVQKIVARRMKLERLANPAEKEPKP